MKSIISRYQQELRDYPVKIIVCVIFFVNIILMQVIPTLSPWSFNDDIAANSYIFWRYHNSNFFPNDIMTQYALSFQPPGIPILFWLFSWLSPIWVSKIFTFVVYGLFLLFISKCFKVIFQNNHLVDLAIILILINHQFFDKVVGANARGFVLPVQALLIYGAIERKKTYIWCAIIGGFLFSPQSFVIGVSLYALMMLYDLINGKFQWREWIITGLIFLFLISFYYYSQHKVEEQFGKPFTLSQTQMMPEFGQNGRMKREIVCSPYREISQALLTPKMGREWRLFWIKTHFDNLSWRTFLQVVLLLLSIIGLINSIKKKNGWVKGIIFYTLSFLICYFGARIFALRLYFPNRFLEPGIQLFFIVFSLFGLSSIINNYCSKMHKKHWILLTVLIVLILGTGLKPGTKLGRIREKDMRIAIEWLRSTPVDTLIAGHPLDLDYIPTLAIRSVYVNRELGTSFRVKYYEEINRRVYLMLNAFYCTDIKSLESLKEEGVDLILLNTERLDGKYIREEGFYYEPFDTEIRKELKPEDYNKFILLNPPNESVLFKMGNIRIISLEKLLSSKKIFS